MSNQSKLNGKLMSSLSELTAFLYKQGQGIYNYGAFHKAKCIYTNVSSLRNP